MGFYLQTRTTPKEKQTNIRTGEAGQGLAGLNTRDTFDDELAQDRKQSGCGWNFPQILFMSDSYETALILMWETSEFTEVENNSVSLLLPNS